MRADNNWEDKVGKRLFDFEGELSPQAWGNINRQIAPKPKAIRRWWWLPLLLVFLSLPVAFFYRNSLKDQFRTATIPGQPKQAKTETLIGKAQETVENKATGLPYPNQASKAEPAGKSKGAQEPQNSSGITSAEITTVQPEPSPKAKPAREITLPGMIAAVQPEPENNRPLAEKTKRKNPATETHTPAIAATRIRKKTVGKTAEKPGAEETGMVAKTATTSAGQAVNSEAKILNNSSETKLTGTGKTAVSNSTVAAGSTSSGSAGQVPMVANASGAETSGVGAGKGLSPEEIKTGKASPLLPDSAEVNTVVAEMPAVETDTLAATLPMVKIPEAAAKTWSFGIYGAPQYTFQRVLANPSDEIMILSLNNQNTFETERLGYEFGFRGYYPLREKLELEVGFHFARLNQCLNFTTASIMADSLVIRDQNGQITMEIRNREQTQILLFKYFFGGLYAGGKVNVAGNWHLTAGLGSNWLLWKNPDEETIPVATVNFNPYLSAGLRYHAALSPKMTLQVGPTLQYFVRPIQKESAFYQSKPTTFGFTIGVLFHQQK